MTDDPDEEFHWPSAVFGALLGAVIVASVAIYVATAPDPLESHTKPGAVQQRYPGAWGSGETVSFRAGNHTQVGDDPDNLTRFLTADEDLFHRAGALEGCHVLVTFTVFHDRTRLAELDRLEPLSCPPGA